MNIIDRRVFLSQLSLAGAAAATAGFGFTSARRPDEFIETEINTGKIKGVRNDGVNVFKGVPYGGKISGNRRFRRPAPLQPWTGVRDATQFGAPAMQPPRRNEPAPSEDCLFLNVWTPANDNRKRPVMFYSHGGGFVGGSGASQSQDGSNLARNFDVVVVQTNHRLGLLGFLYLDEIAGPEYAGSGNMGMLDIADGLKWVNQNIAQFGGDPDNVMIFGESGGGAKTSCLYTMPAAAPYFNKASIESGPGVRMTTKETAAETTAMLLKELNIAAKDWKKLLNIPAADLLAMQAKLPFVPPFIEKTNNREAMQRSAGGFGPVVDGVVLPQHPFDPVAPEISKSKPLLVGWNEDEHTFFAWERKDTESFKIDFEGLKKKLEPRYGENTDKLIETYRKANPNASAPDVFVAISSIAMMGLGSVTIAERKVKQGGAPVYLYNFGYKSEKKIPGTDYAMGTPHAMDISFKFNNEIPPRDGSAPKESFFGGNNPDRFVASNHFAELWTTFARTGKPAAKDVPEWPAYNLKDRPTMRIDTKCEIINDRFAQELATWRALGKL
ncbi:carboxylesterase/lipase family protein [Dyadobacter chenhuakuii]|uniref:Carboxylic ester hydrolase n=1 Tax=Dyadobacter chenhuakuii TaxID=2909339 RepID=A0ABY4XNK6_9BACT|nr:carboxylesterase family protein [Dyadobacter chenhuakuii]MCF2495096.1 carboxylesterase family protein [Dyadobacter chenhuakuii]USJ31592.1 carboxylesterase family protein [Dyadobacter chenhuakuii]